jgi:hypothetical protein
VRVVEVAVLTRPAEPALEHHGDIVGTLYEGCVALGAFSALDIVREIAVGVENACVRWLCSIDQFASSLKHISKRLYSRALE